MEDYEDDDYEESLPDTTTESFFYFLQELRKEDMLPKVIGGVLIVPRVASVVHKFKTDEWEYITHPSLLEATGNKINEIYTTNPRNFELGSLQSIVVSKSFIDELILYCKQGKKELAEEVMIAMFYEAEQQVRNNEGMDLTERLSNDNLDDLEDID